MTVSPRKACGFGLLSLLVSVAIAAVLAMLGLGVFTRAQQKTRGVTCMNNLRQIGVALYAYLADHNWRYPPNRANPAYKDDKNPAGVHWQDALKGYLKPYPDSGPITGAMAGVFWCPADLARRDGLAQHSYGANVHIGGAEPQEKQNIRLEPAPARRLYLVEMTRETLSTGNFADNQWPFNGGNPERPDTNAHVDFRHGGVAHGLFLDGRVAPLTISNLWGKNPYLQITPP